MATTSPKPPRLRIERPTARDRKLWTLWKLEKTVQEIAAQQHMSVKSVQDAIDRVESYRYLPSSELLSADIHATSMELLEEVKEPLRGALKAKTVRTKSNGREIVIDDHSTRLAAVKEIREMAALSQPKGAGVQVNVQNNNLAATQRLANGTDFESRLRVLRAKNAGQLPAVAQAQLMAPQEKTQAEILAEDMEGAGIELEDSEIDELEGEFEDEESSDGEDPEESEDLDDADDGEETPESDEAEAAEGSGSGTQDSGTLPKGSDDLDIEW